MSLSKNKDVIHNFIVLSEGKYKELAQKNLSTPRDPDFIFSYLKQSLNELVENESAMKKSPSKEQKTKKNQQNKKDEFWANLVAHIRVSLQNETIKKFVIDVDENEIEITNDYEQLIELRTKILSSM